MYEGARVNGTMNKDITINQLLMLYLFPNAIIRIHWLIGWAMHFLYIYHNGRRALMLLKQTKSFVQ